ncbi:hypothetical protein XELAEV_18041225mg [Xenopus laevis]|uniref:Uncharacterized protein n=1 Tax=Xenopus laevis TaxID=8355 RepID=A0A974H4X1_XENLA|nr:hypothetical protein XELAEV_18041225mg [Xenopus laevis]
MELGHTHRQCPEAWHIVKNCPNVESEYFAVWWSGEVGCRKRESGVLPLNETPEENLVRHQDQTQTGDKEGGGWKTVGSKSKKSKEERIVLRPDLEISNRFVLPEGNSLEDLPEEEELKIMEKEEGREVVKLKRKKKSKAKKVSSAVSSPEGKREEKMQDQPTQGNSETSLEGITEEKKRNRSTENEEDWESFGEEEISYQTNEGCSSGLGKFQEKWGGSVRETA